MADIEFSRGPARRPAPVIEAPILQWASGLQTRDRSIYAGWMVEAGKLDDLDEAMAAAGFNQVTIKHGSGNTVTHWAVTEANVFVICEGVQTIREMRDTDERYGIAFNWRRADDGRPQSVLRARVILRKLAMHGYVEPLTLSVKSTTTGDVIAALLRQYDVFDAGNAFRKLDGKVALEPPFYACSIALGPGQEIARGTGGQTKEITPPIAVIPAPIDREYLRANWIMRPLVPTIEGLLDQTVAWSVAESRRIRKGDDAQPQHDDEALL